MSNEQSIRDEIADEIAGVVVGEGYYLVVGEGYYPMTIGIDAAREAADLLLASPVIRRIQAETLREAARPFMDRLNGEGNGRAYNSYTVARLLKERADAIERGETT